jgi:DNA helicase IV
MPADAVIDDERHSLTQARDYLNLMRENVLGLEALGADRISVEFLKLDLYRRAEALRDIPDAPLFFGRLFLETSEDFHIGRRHVHDTEGKPVVLDWRAPMSRPFYRASQADPMGLVRRRRFGFDGGALTAFEDEAFGEGAADLRYGSKLLIEEIERPRSGPMRDIVATIQPEQDDIVRSDSATTVCVQGAPGTGKTAVGLHRVAYLLYAYKELVTRRGVVVIGPNRAFLSYIRNVLPALGELDVTQTTIGDLVASTPIRGTDSDAVAVIKGDARIAEALCRAL